MWWLVDCLALLTFYLSLRFNYLNGKLVTIRLPNGPWLYPNLPCTSQPNTCWLCQSMNDVGIVAFNCQILFLMPLLTPCNSCVLKTFFTTTFFFNLCTGVAILLTTSLTLTRYTFTLSDSYILKFWNSLLMSTTWQHLFDHCLCKPLLESSKHPSLILNLQLLGVALIKSWLNVVHAPKSA